MKSRELCLAARDRIQASPFDAAPPLLSSSAVNGQRDFKSTRRTAQATRKASQSARRKSALLRSAVEVTIQHSMKLKAQGRTPDQVAVP